MNTKERPNCRETIVKHGLRPTPAPETWNGKTAVLGSGREISLTAGLRKQMGKMIQEGYWGQPLSIRKIRKTVNESQQQREARLQALCDTIVLLKHTRPIATGFGDKMVAVRHSWPLSRTWEYEFSYRIFQYVPIKKPTFHWVPGWVFEEGNPISATARAVFAYLCNRGLLNPDKNGKTKMTAVASRKDIGDALSIPESVAGRALDALEELDIIHICRPRIGAPKNAIYFNSITAIEDGTRWSRIKAAQAECSAEDTETPRRRKEAHPNRLIQTRFLSDPSMDSSAVNGASLLPNHGLDELPDDEDLSVNMNADRAPQNAISPKELAAKSHVADDQPPATLTPAHKILEKNPSLLNSCEDRDKLIRRLNKTGRNEPCPCTSGRKFKKCCGGIFNS